MAISLGGINAALVKVDKKILQKATNITEAKVIVTTNKEKLELLERIRVRLIDAKRALELANENAGELE